MAYYNSIYYIKEIFGNNSINIPSDISWKYKVVNIICIPNISYVFQISGTVGEDVNLFCHYYLSIINDNHK